MRLRALLEARCSGGAGSGSSDSGRRAAPRAGVLLARGCQLRGKHGAVQLAHGGGASARQRLQAAPHEGAGRGGWRLRAACGAARGGGMLLAVAPAVFSAV